jgi:uncharacterized protein (TIGR02996 family)
VDDEEAFQKALDEEKEQAHDTRLVFADWLQDRDDPRAEGYRILATQWIYANWYFLEPKSSRTWRTWRKSRKSPRSEAHRTLYYMPHELNEVWFLELKGGRSDPNDPDYRTYPSRREAEDAAALAFFRLPEDAKELVRSTGERELWYASVTVEQAEVVLHKLAEQTGLKLPTKEPEKG